jgi:hypothetical protein
MTFISVLSETQSRNSACMRRTVCKAVTKNQKAITFSWERSSLLMVLKSLGFWRRKCRPRVKSNRADIAAWRLKYVKHIKMYWDNGHTIYYINKMWTGD